MSAGGLRLVAGHVGAVDRGGVRDDGIRHGSIPKGARGGATPLGRTRRLESLRPSSTAREKSSSMAGGEWRSRRGD